LIALASKGPRRAKFLKSLYLFVCCLSIEGDFVAGGAEQISC
jgi:hypothetical protein